MRGYLDNTLVYLIKNKVKRRKINIHKKNKKNEYNSINLKIEFIIKKMSAI